MLQPLPADRPASMAAVAAWEPGDAIPTAPRAPRALLLPNAVREREPAGGRVAAMLAAVIALGSVGGAGYVFRGEIAQWGQSIIAPAPPGRPSNRRQSPRRRRAPCRSCQEPTVGAPEQTPGAASPAPSLAPAPASPPPSSAGASDATATGSASDAERASQGATTQPPPGSAGPSERNGNRIGAERGTRFAGRGRPADTA